MFIFSPRQARKFLPKYDETFAMLKNIVVEL